MDGERKPRIRAEIEFFYAGTKEEPFLVARDPENYANGVERLAPGALAVLRYFDGEHTLVDIQRTLTARDGTQLPIDQLEEFTSALDAALFLEGDRFEGAKGARSDWLAASVRPATHSDAAYPADPGDAAVFLDQHLAHAPNPAAGPLRRLIAPHIDLRLGSDVHGHAHARVRAAGRPDVVVVIGVCHQPAEAPFIACRKDFATPCGVVRHDTAFLDALEGGFGAPLTPGELAHETEHSVEFQALWLAHHWPEQPPTLVPLLARGFHELIEAGRSPREDEDVERFLSALRKTIAADGRDILVIASVDLAHVGPLYDTAGLDEAGERNLATSDRVLLDAIVANDADAFFDAIAADHNATQVCGVAPIYLTLRLGAGSGELLRYGQGRIHPESGSVVSYAAVGFPD